MNHFEHIVSSLCGHPPPCARATRPTRVAAARPGESSRPATPPACGAPTAPADSEQAWALRFGRLTPREQEVLHWIVEDKISKEIAQLLGISRKTVDFHRANLMEKLQARSLIHLIKMAITQRVA
jgi:DNA-binding CsgD family transcriptional regulator